LGLQALMGLRERLSVLSHGNMLPSGQQLWLKDLQTYVDFPPMQDPVSYNLEQVMQQLREMKSTNPAGD